MMPQQIEQLITRKVLAGARPGEPRGLRDVFSERAIALIASHPGAGFWRWVAVASLDAGAP